jgi:hypothetical protein
MLHAHARFARGACCTRRAQKVLELLKKEVELCKLQADIREQVGVLLLRARLCVCVCVSVWPP